MKNKIYNFRESNSLSRQYKDLSDTTPFIDYVQVHCNKLPISYQLCLEDDNNRFRFYINNKFIDYTYKEISKTIHQYTLANGSRFWIYGFYWIEGDFAGTNAKAKIYIPASSLPNSTLTIQINRIKKIIESMRPNKYYRTANNEKLPYMKSCIKWYDCSLSRIDLAINCYKSNYFLNGELKNDFDFENLSITYKNRPSIRKYFNGNHCTGIDIGSGKNSTQLKIYDKDFDPNNHHDLERFGTTNFARIEYKIPRYILRNSDLEGYVVMTPADLTSKKIELLWLNCLKTKHINLWSLYKMKIPRSRRIKIDIKIKEVRTLQMVKGLLNKFEHKNKYKKLIKKIDEFFLKELNVNEKTIQDTNRIIYN